jgi:hypothetical protein
MINRLPVKLFKKLLTCYEEIFSESALKLHIESEKRRHAKPLVVTENDIQTFSDTTIASDTKEPEKEYQNTKRSSTIMSFIRPSVMGVFQKNSAPNPISPKPSTNRSVSLSFGSPITRSESPPLSPKGQNIHDVPDNLQALTTPSKAAASVVMFDIDDVGFFNDSVFENNSKSDAILKDMDTNNEFKSGRSDALITSLEVKEEVVDSFFFDDDDDDDDD